MRWCSVGLLASMALTSLLTGVTEPIEFSFMFLAPVLYVIHALLTGLSLAICSALGIHLGFTFSAGLIDYILNYGLSTRGCRALPLGVIYAVAYYGLFRFFIRKFNMATPGREPAGADEQVESFDKGWVRCAGSCGNSAACTALHRCFGVARPICLSSMPARRVCVCRWWIRARCRNRISRRSARVVC